MNTGLGDVLSGDKAIQVAISFDTNKAIMIGVGLFLIIVLAGITIKKI